jgi:hypothetical protein
LDDRWQKNGISFGRNEGDNLKVAIATAQILDSDLTFDRYDWTYAKYQPPWKKVSPISNNNVILQPKEMTLLEIWERYKGLKEESTAKSTKDNKSSDRRSVDSISVKIFLLSHQ